MTQVVILGAGMAGFGAAHRLHGEGVGSVMYEQKPYHGGHTASFHRDGFIFDDGPTSRSPRMRAFNSCSRTACSSSSRRSTRM